MTLRYSYVMVYIYVLGLGDVNRETRPHMDAEFVETMVNLFILPMYGICM